MTEPPTYTVATDFDEIEQLRESLMRFAPTMENSCGC